MRYWDEYDDSLLADFIFDSNLSTREIAKELDREELEVTKRIRELGLSWVRRNKGHHASRGAAALISIIRKLLPGETVVTEEHIGERLMLDVYCPKYKLAAEYHGRQHFYYTEHFHGNKDGFRESQRRDERKEELCRDLGIALVIFRYNDVLTEDAVYQRMLDALRSTPAVEEVKSEGKWKNDPMYESWKNRQREYRRDAYRKMKAQRGRG